MDTQLLRAVVAVKEQEAPSLEELVMNLYRYWVKNIGLHTLEKKKHNVVDNPAYKNISLLCSLKN